MSQAVSRAATGWSVAVGSSFIVDIFILPAGTSAAPPAEPTPPRGSSAPAPDHESGPGKGARDGRGKVGPAEAPTRGGRPRGGRARVRRHYVFPPAPAEVPL